MDIRYKIEFFSDWHCGSGLSAGADVDLLVIKDKSECPFIPGRTLKGLLREAAEDILSFRGCSPDLEESFVNAFGYSDGNPDATEIAIRGTMFFTNAELPAEERRVIIANGLQPYLYRQIASTAIASDGVAADHSLRKMETVVPCTLYGEILDVPEGLGPLLEDSLRFVKRMGHNRTRGMGRCKLTII